MYWFGHMFWRMAKTILILPGTALIYVPLLIQWVSGGWPFGPAMGGSLGWALAAILAVPAVLLAVWTVKLFIREGDGTPAPWDPPRKFVVSGPYRHVRNPMLTAVILMILAEAAALGSVALLGWAIAFFVLNTAYFALVEEPGLERRFGDAYRHYKSAVGRWMPSLRPYEAAAKR